MRRLFLVGLASTLPMVAALAIQPGPASALPGGENSTTTTAPPTTIAAEVTLPPSEDAGREGVTATTVVRIPCSWTDVGTTQQRVDDLNETQEFIEDVLAPINDTSITAVLFYERFGVLHRAGSEPGTWLKAQVADCTNATHRNGVTSGSIRWVISLPPDPADQLPGQRERVTEIIQPPASAINPTTTGIVNLGMWLAVAEAGPYTARAQLPPTGPAIVWAEVTATQGTTTFTFDHDGTTVTCDGAGTPIPDEQLDDPREGPCGYTYTNFVGDTTITITTNWAISWELSDGRTGTDPNPWPVTTVVPYEVKEIQTVGVAP